MPYRIVVRISGNVDKVSGPLFLLVFSLPVLVGNVMGFFCLCFGLVPEAESPVVEPN